MFGPFLIWPALVVLDRMLVRRVRLTDVFIVGILLLGLLLELFARRLVSFRGVLRRHDRRLPFSPRKRLPSACAFSS